jgi:hypothetical protein
MGGEAMRWRLRSWAAAIALSAGAGAALADYTDGVIRIGVLNDQSGLYSDITGQGSVWAARKAVEDYCKLRATIPAEQAFRPLAESDCPLVKK